MKKMKYNAIPKQEKTSSSRIEPQEWNYIINVLKEQANHNSSILEDVPLLRKDLEKLTTEEMEILKANIETLFSDLEEHFQNKNNPHNVKADQVEYVPNENVKEAIDRSAKVDEENVFTERQEFTRGIYTDGILMDSDSKITGLGDGTDPQDAVNKSQLDKKVDKITEAQRDSLGVMSYDDRIVYAVDYNLNETPIKASPFKEKNTIVMRDRFGNFQDLYDHNTNPTAHQDIRNMIAALQGGIIPRGLIQYTSNDIRFDKILLYTYIQNNYSREPQLGDMVRDLDNIEWYYNGEFWDELGPYSLIPLASPYNDGLMSITHLKILSQLEADTIFFYSDTHGIPVKIKFKKFQLAEGETMDDALPTLPVIDYEVEGGYIPIIRYTFYDSDGNIVGESMGNKPITTGSGGEVDLNEMAYFDYAGRIYGDKYSLLKNAWEHSLTVDPEEISKAQYPNGETEGVIIPQGVTSIGSWAFDTWTSNNQPLVIPNSVTNIDSGAFFDWTSNNHPLIIPNGVTSIGDYAFMGWSTNNQPLVISNSVTSIGAQAFYYWWSNTHPLVIPESVTSIGTYAFYGWLLVPYVEIQATTPPSLAGTSAFSGQNDAPIYVPDESVDDYKEATNWVDLADRIFPISDRLVSGGGEVDPNVMAYFNYASRIYGDKYSLLVSAWEHSLTVDPLEISENGSYGNYRGKAQYPNGETDGVIIPQGVTSIGMFAFRVWPANNQPLVIANSVTNIKACAFENWTSNNQPLVIPNSVTNIGELAFNNWSSNNQPLIIPNSVTNIGELAFNGWSLVPYVEIQAITPPSLSSADAFAEQNNAPIYVPDESVDDYKTATNWVDLADRIFPISDRLVSASAVDLNEMAYFDYAGRIYGDKYSLLLSAWEHSLTVDPLEIGTAQYPNGETEGVIIPHGVTSIGSWTFDSWTSNNQPLVIPNSVTNIDSGAFFDWSSNNHPLIIPNGVTSIGDYAFYGWSSNNQPLVIPNSVTSIGAQAFYYWSSNNHPLVIPNSVTSIGDYAFCGWSLVPYVEIQAIVPPSLANADAFVGQNNAPIYVPDESVDDYKEATNWVDLADRIFPISDRLVGASGGDLNAMAYFNYASRIYGDKYNLLVSAWEHSLTVNVIDKDHYPNGEIEGVIIPQGVTSIGAGAFFNWQSNNQPLVIPNSVTSIGISAFLSWSSNNQPLVIPNSVTSIDGQAFSGWSANNQPLTISNSVTSIDEATFGSWSSNNQPLVIPNSVTSIGDGAFADWHSNNQPLTISNSVTNIGNGSFYAWRANNHPLVIPNSVTNIGDAAFHNWPLVPYVEIQATTPPSLAGASAFSAQNDAPIYVPDESVEAYKTATNWVDLADRIFSINDKE